MLKLQTHHGGLVRESVADSGTFQLSLLLSNLDIGKCRLQGSWVIVWPLANNYLACKVPEPLSSKGI